MNKLEQALFAIEELVVKCPRIPFTSRALVDEDRLLDLVEELRNLIPPEVNQAQELVAQRDQILEEARREAEAIVAEARQQAATMTSEHVITQEAVLEAERIRKQLEHDIQQQQAGADRYSEELLSELETKISRALTIIQNGRNMLNSNQNKG